MPGATDQPSKEGSRASGESNNQPVDEKDEQQQRSQMSSQRRWAKRRAGEAARSYTCCGPVKPARHEWELTLWTVESWSWRAQCFLSSVPPRGERDHKELHLALTSQTSTSERQLTLWANWLGASTLRVLLPPNHESALTRSAHRKLCDKSLFLEKSTTQGPRLRSCHMSESK